MVRRSAKVTGLVQGIGFRPFVHRVASQLGLTGFVRNEGSHVLIQVEGAAATLSRFQQALTDRLPPLARIDRVEWQDCPPQHDRAFEIVASEPDGGSRVSVPADVATCPECLTELFDPADRRYRYPFLNCTHCGPRLTIITGVPYDRAQTTMSRFDMCDACRREYEDPANRRFHAEPTACPVCGPRLALETPDGTAAATDDPLRAAAESLRRGAIVAIKGLGGYHLACLASDGAAVERLRGRKHREEKPFAIMVRDLAAAEAICEVSYDEARLLEDVRRPIVLLKRRSGHAEELTSESEPRASARADVRRNSASPDSFGSPLVPATTLGILRPGLDLASASVGDVALRKGVSIANGTGFPCRESARAEARGSLVYPIADAVAPGNPLLGVMLPYTPLHHLLMAEMDGTPLVMTSGNLSDEPIAYEDSDARQRFAGLADLLLTHDRPIHRRCDDSIVRVTGGAPLILRRSRGYVPQPLSLPSDCRIPILAVGGQLKATFALGAGHQAMLSHHGGDLDDFSAFRAYTQAIDDFERFFDIQPALLVHDLHPDYATTRYALQRCESGNSSEPRACARADLQGPTLANRTPRRLAVQHHHAHLASCLAENGSTETAIGVIFDGTGYGLDGAVWGGEFLVGDLSSFRRAAHLRYVPMPGGEQAIHEPWRMAAAHLIDAVGFCEALQRHVSRQKLSVIERMIRQRINAPLTSSMGRLFDAVAALAGIRQTAAYEGQAAIELEWAASTPPLNGSPNEAVWHGLPARDSTGSNSVSLRGHGGSAVAQQPDDAYAYAVTPAAADRQPDHSDAPMIIDTRPLIRNVLCAVRASVDPAVIARRFHATLVELIVDVCGRLRAQTGVSLVALSGGVFMNVLLLEGATARLQRDGFRVIRHRQVPPNDGGLSLGQLAIAAAVAAKDVALQSG